MTYNSKRTIASMIAGILLLAAYLIYALGNRAPRAGDLRGWAMAILVFIGIGVVGVVLVQILFHIALAIGIAVKEREKDSKKIERIMAASMVEDERDRLIGQKSAHIASVCAGVGFVAALVVWAFGGATVPGLHILMGAFAVGSLLEGAVSVRLHEGGVRNG